MLENERKPKPLEDVLKAAKTHKKWLRNPVATGRQTCNECPYDQYEDCVIRMNEDVTFYLETILENAEEGRK